MSKNLYPFPLPTLPAWRELAETTLKGASFEERLVGTTFEGIRIEPLYTREGAAAAIAAAGGPNAVPFLRGQPRNPAAPWVVAQRIDLLDPAEANRQALADLASGASGLIFVGRSPGARRGIRLETAVDLDRLMAAVLSDLVALTVEAGAEAGRVAALFAAWADRRGLDPAVLHFSPGLDPIAVLARSGHGPDRAEIARGLAETVAFLRDRRFKGPFVLVDGRVWNEAGAGEAQELGYMLAGAVESARLLEARGIDPDWAAETTAFKLALDTDQFLSIAKIRALRLLWARVTEAMGIGSLRAEIRVESARRAMTRRDPWVNLLRGTMAAFAGAVGGADEIALHPFTDAIGVPDGFARRLARNTQTILAEEAYLGAVTDPAAGSGAVESLTQALAEKAWTVFQETEAAGGLLKALTAGLPQAAIAKVRAARAKAIATRRAALIGVSEFADVAEVPVPTLPEDSAPPSPTPAGPMRIEPLPSHRLAEPYEVLRDRADAHAARTGARARIFLATLGSTADTTPRATFAKNVLEAGGFLALFQDGHTDIAALLASFRASGAQIVCLCATDEVYETSGEAAARALKAAGARLLILAGKGGARAAALKEAGVDLYIHAGMDVPAALDDIQRRAGLVMA